jgi:hypothetical protein
VYGDAAAEQVIADGVARWHERTGARWHSTLILCQIAHTCPPKPPDLYGRSAETADPQSTKEISQSPCDTADAILGPEFDMARGYLPTRSPRNRIEQARPVQPRGTDPQTWYGNGGGDARALDAKYTEPSDAAILQREFRKTVSDGVQYRDVRVELFCLGCYQQRREPSSRTTLRVPVDVNTSSNQFWTCRQCTGVGMNSDFKKWYDTQHYIFGMTGRKQQVEYIEPATVSDDDRDEMRRESEMRTHFEGILQDKFVRSLITVRET